MLAAKVFVHTWSSLIVFELNWTCFMKYMFCSVHLNWLSALFEFQQYWRTLIVTLVDFGWFSVIRKNGTTKVYFDWMKVDNRLTVLWHRSVGGQQGGGEAIATTATEAPRAAQPLIQRVTTVSPSTAHNCRSTVWSNWVYSAVQCS